MRFYSFILLFLAFLTINANAQNKRDEFDINNYKQTINYPDHYVMFYARSSSDQPKFSNPDKLYFWYSSNQIKTTQGGFSGKLLHGTYTDFYANKSLKEQGDFNMGLKTGKWKKWDENGTLTEIVNYRSGTVNGRFSRYNNSGALIETGSYKNGKINGVLKRYISADSIQIVKYKNGIALPADIGKLHKKGLFRKQIKQK